MKTLAAIAQEITQDHNWTQAETDLQVGLQSNPKSAKGWYFYAQVENHLGKLIPAQNALDHANSLDPSHSFTTPAKYDQFYNQVHAKHVSLAPALTPTVTTPLVQTAAPVAVHSNNSPYIIGGFLLLILIGIVFLIRRSNAKSSAVVAPVGVEPVFGDDARPYSNRNVPPAYARPAIQQPVQPTFNPRSAVNFQQPAQPVYQQPAPVYQQPVYQQPSYNGGSHLGLGIAGGLAAGVLLDEVLSDRSSHRDYNPAPYVDTSPAPAPSNDFDSGTSSSDWGSSNSSSDDSSSSFDSGSSDSGSFDSGSSSDSGSSDW